MAKRSDRHQNAVPMPKEVVYSVQLRQARSFHRIKNNVYALADHDDHGKLIKKYVIVELVERVDKDIYVCTCNGEHRMNVKYGVNAPTVDHSKCLHVYETLKLWPNPDSNLEHFPDLLDSVEQGLIVHLGTSLLSSYCEYAQTYGILSEAARTIRCLTCHSKVTNCCHIKSYKKHALDCGFDPSTKVTSEEDYNIISQKPISYPLHDDDADIFTMYASGMRMFKTDLIPRFDPSKFCAHGHAFDNRDPSKNYWVINRDATIHYKYASIKCTSFYRPSLGTCTCKQFYDGREDLVLNLDNRHLFSYMWLFDILHDTQETRYPLAAAFRSSNRTRTVCGHGPLAESAYKHLRIAYNSFLRLLDLDFGNLYTCRECGPEVDCIIMDGIMMGSRQDLVPEFDMPTLSDEQIPDCPPNKRTFVSNVNTRKQLAIYTCLNRGIYGELRPMALPAYNDLCQSLQKLPSLQTVVKEAGPLCPASHRLLLGELSRGSPTCGILQIQCKDSYSEVHSILQEVANGDKSRVLSHSATLKKNCPLLYGLLSADDINAKSLANLVNDLLSSIELPYRRTLPSDAHYSGPHGSHDIMDFFPNHPVLRGIGNYKANNSKEQLVTGCRKDSFRHNTLTPGLFTLFCKHGVCLGFKMMDNFESPRTAFDILVSRFKSPPKLIIYDNACKLHLYCLKREPVRFKQTRFMVDRLHYRKGHIGCSLGYSMDTYKDDDSIVNINSQANEQANASLRRLTTQLVYMNPHNVIKHTSVFLAVRNMDKMLRL